ncbi:3'(2'),5'-bisphosphate nucleotidase CysQ family protein [Turneriella parva]|uniref:3'(2'),5'-bisphosphate nucleotidase n=1 Tax=Turneriella parva (strain ATCC BAA-1111 / DSM 21527 / NCTC 11395 / H) TaxID=869212 RepID=I4B177_TURPD|nr:3'(2'),5'-bisphosphate nucleotidase CysQ [Turneriella parva]AFM11034.1 3'(2'),5'-bisphosphate nucleotidase [Turneriella parva DSM 21527]
MNESYAREHDSMLPVVREAGEAVMQFYTSQKYSVQHKDPENPVTEADYAAHRVIVGAIKRLFPQDAILSEESDSAEETARMQRDRFERPRVWIIDPIDGTREFIKGRDEFAVSVGLVAGDRAVAGFVFNPAKGYLLSGAEGIGLFLNGEKFTRMPEKPFAPPRIVVSRSEFKAGELKHLENAYPKLADYAVGSIAYKLALIADGTYDLAVSVRPKNEWDLAGGAALMNIAGLELADKAGAPMRFNKRALESSGIVAGTPAACAWYRSLAQ